MRGLRVSANLKTGRLLSPMGEIDRCGERFMIDWGAKIRGFCFVAAGFAAALAVVVTVSAIARYGL